MKVELAADIAEWVEAEVAAGSFPTPEDAVRQAVTEYLINGLRAKLDAAVEEGGSHTSADVRRLVREQLEKRNEPAAAN